jgi:hypothetical protein
MPTNYQKSLSFIASVSLPMSHWRLDITYIEISNKRIADSNESTFIGPPTNLGGMAQSFPTYASTLPGQIHIILSLDWNLQLWFGFVKIDGLQFISFFFIAAVSIQFLQLFTATIY